MTRHYRLPLLAGAAGAALLGCPVAAQERAEEELQTTEAASSEAILVLGDRLEESQPEEIEKYGSRLETVEGE